MSRSFEELFACGPGYSLWTAGTWNPAGKLLPAVDPERAEGDVTPEHWAEHRQGSRALIVSPTLPDRTCVFGVIDVDPINKSDRGPKVAVELMQLLHNKELPFAVCESKSNGAHAYIFFETAELVSDVHKVLAHICDRLDIKRKFKANIDLRPSPTMQGGGTQIQLPYFGDTPVPGAHSARQMQLEGKYLGFEEFVEWCNLHAIIDFPTFRKNVSAQLGAIVAKHTLIDRVASYEDKAKQGPPCFEVFMLDEAGANHEGHRDELLSHLSARLVMMFPDDWETMLNTFNLSMDTPLPPRDVARIIRQQKSTGFGLFCNRDFVQHVCQKDVCSTRQFGVLARNTATQIVGVEISKIVKFKPPEGDDQNVYPVHIYLDGKDGYIIADQKSLVSYNALSEAILHRYKMYIPHMTGQAFREWMGSLLAREGDRFFEEPMPREMTTQGRFERAAKDHIRSFLNTSSDIPRDAFARGTIIWDNDDQCLVMDPGVFADAIRRAMKGDMGLTPTRIMDMFYESDLLAKGTRPWKALYRKHGAFAQLLHFKPRCVGDEGYDEEERETLWFDKPEKKAF